MIYGGPQSGRLNTEVYADDACATEEVDDLVRLVLGDTPEFDSMAEPTRQLLIRAVQKAVVAGIEAESEYEPEPETEPEDNHEQAEAIAEVALANLDISPTSAYVTHHDVRQAAVEAALIALQPPPTEAEIASSL